MTRPTVSAVAGLCLALTVFAACPLSAQQVAGKELAYIARLDLGIFFDGEEDYWCLPGVMLRFETGDASLYEREDALAPAIARLAKLLKHRCPSMEELMIVGTVRGEQRPQTVGVAAQDTGWRIEFSDPGEPSG